MAVAAVVLALVIAVCAGLLIGSRVTGSHPGENSVEAGFARDMQVHHAQAVEMSYAVATATEDEAVRSMAYDILTSQQAQIGRMSGWLDDWDLPAYSSAPLMAWMTLGDGGHGSHGSISGETDPDTGDALMPGMATTAEMDQLRGSRGRAAEILFLQLMIEHHRGGVDMAQYAAEHAEEEQVVLFADRIASSQAAEIDAMNDMLVQRGAEPV